MFDRAIDEDRHLRSLFYAKTRNLRFARVGDPWLKVMAPFAYIDDSGSSPNEPIYVLGGLVQPSESWNVFSDDWKAVLRHPPSVEYFKGSEVWDRTKGPFASLTTGERMEKVESLADLVFVYKPLAISCRVRWTVFNEFRESVRLESELDDPYFFLFFGIIGQMIGLGHEEPVFRRINFIFDSQNEIGKHVKMWFAVFLSRCTDRVREHLGEYWPDFGDEKQVMPLQAADMFAWYQRRSALNNLGNQFHERIWERLHRDRYYAVEVERPNLEAIARDLSAIAI